MRSVSETSTEDNRPLAQMRNLPIIIETKSLCTTSQVTDKKHANIGKIIIKSPETFKNRMPTRRVSITKTNLRKLRQVQTPTQTNKIKKSQFRLSVTPATSHKLRTQSRSRNKPVVKTVNIEPSVSLRANGNRAFTREPPVQDQQNDLIDLTQDTNERQKQQNSLADFVIKIFNCDVTEMRCGERNVDRRGGHFNYIYDWLGNDSDSDTDPRFKVPATPRWRASTSLPLSTLGNNSPNLLSRRERNLRCHCIAWNYRTMSDVIRKKSLIRLFCGQCTRCVVMFQSQWLKSTVSTAAWNLTGDSDVCDLTMDTDDVYIDGFHKISNAANHVSDLRRVMTNKGKYIFNAAVIIRDKIETNQPLLPEEHNMIAHVLGLLIQCNTARIEESQHPNVERMPSKRLVFDDNSSLATSSKRQHLESLSSSSPTPMCQSKKFYPSEKDFRESPIRFALKIKQNYPGISLCGIIPPQRFNPRYVSGSNETNFRMKNEYIHRTMNRWGDATRQLTLIRSTQDSKIQRSPLFEGLELDLVKLFHTVQEENGFESFQANREKWQVVADKMRLVCQKKVVHKLDNIYMKYILSYDILTPGEREAVARKVQSCWRNREISSVVRAQKPLWRQEHMRLGLSIADDEISTHLDKVCTEAEECVTPGRYINYQGFEKLGNQVQRTYFPEEDLASPEDVEREFWDIVMRAKSHVCVHAASVDAGEHGCGFDDGSAEPYGLHPWNLKSLCWSEENLLSYLGPTLGVSSTSIHYGMMFSTNCWHMDPTAVPWIEYLHSGPPKIWYTISANQEQTFRAAAEALCPFAVQNKDIWLPCDIIMIPPNLLRQYGITVERHVQHPGEYVIVYPRTYCASINTGLTISEGVYFAPHTWIEDIEDIFLNLRKSCEPSLFSMEKLLVEMSLKDSTPYHLLQRVHTVLTSLLCAELSYRQGMVDRNVEIMSPQAFLEQNHRATISSWQLQKSGECAYCRSHLYFSRVVGVSEGQTGVCAMHGVELFDSAVSRQVQLSRVYCIMLITNGQIYDIINTLKSRMMGSIRAAV